MLPAWQLARPLGLSIWWGIVREEGREGVRERAEETEREKSDRAGRQEVTQSQQDGGSD